MTANTVRSRKAKGQGFVKDLAYAIARKIPEAEKYIHMPSSGVNGRDLIFFGPLKTFIPLAIEAKRTERIQIPIWWKQAEKNTEEGEVTAVIYKRNHESAKIVLTFEDFLTLITRNKEWELEKPLEEPYLQAQ